MKRHVWLISTIVALCIGTVIGYWVARYKSPGSRIRLQQAILETSFGQAVEASRSGDPSASAQAQRDYLAINNSKQMEDWPTPWVLDIQRVAAYSRLGVALDTMSQTELANEAFVNAIALTKSLATDPDMGYIWKPRDNKQALIDWIREVDSKQ